mgnify:FL=1
MPENTSIRFPSIFISTGSLSDLSPSTSDSNSTSEEILILHTLIYSILLFSTISPFNKSGIIDDLEMMEASFKIKIFPYPSLFSSNSFLFE